MRGICVAHAWNMRARARACVCCGVCGAWQGIYDSVLLMAGVCVVGLPIMQCIHLLKRRYV